MRIKQISVSGLFGIFDHVIPLNMDERITIIHGPNGFGKTAILRILNIFFNSRNAELRAIPFRNFRVEFDNNSSVEIIKDAENAEELQKNDIVLKFYQPDSEPASFSLKPRNIRSDIDFPLGILDDVIPGLERIAPRKWLYNPTGDNSFFRRSCRAL
ncbi:AAA family ATPase [Nostoc sp.]|uniref:AAA family ATPase n=1 Tax=Nostoc sp. TaxID=1180 RepID=UPI002FFD1028